MVPGCTEVSLTQREKEKKRQKEIETEGGWAGPTGQTTFVSLLMFG